jgi:Zn-dependent protease with chaperone function
MATPPAHAPCWISEYKAALPKTEKAANKIRNNLRYVIVVFLVTPVIAISFFLPSTNLREFTNATITGLIDASLTIGLFIGLGLYERNPDAPTFRSAAFVLCVSALSFIDTSSVLGLPPGEDPSANDSSLGQALGSLIGSSLWLVAAGFMLRSRVRFFERGKVTAAYILINRKVAKELWCHIDEIAQKAATLGLAPPVVSAWLSRTNAEQLPTVCTSNGGRISNLLIPRPFLRLLLENRERASAILAHELSHFYQNDANLWTTTDLFFAVLRRTAFPLLVINVFIISLASLVAGRLPNIYASIALVVTIFSSQRLAAAARKESEFRADQFASNVCSREALIASIQEYTNDDSPLHPSRRERIAALEPAKPAAAE